MGSYYIVFSALLDPHSSSGFAHNIPEEDCKQEEGHDRLREREIVTCFISFLRLYMDRCRSLHLTVEFNSSLPSLSKIVPSRSPLLRVLDIQCQSDDGIHLEEVEEEDDVDNDKQEEYYPRLRFMKLDARCFLRSINNPPDWLIHQRQLRHAEISTFASQSFRLPLEDTVSTINRLCPTSLLSLCLSRVDLDPDFHIQSIDRVPGSSYMFNRVKRLHFCEMEPDFVENVLDICNFANLTTLTLRDCPGVKPRIFTKISSIVTTLNLEEFSKIKDSKDPEAHALPHADIIRLLSGWRGSILSLSASDSSFDSIFSALAERSSGWRSRVPGPSSLLCPNMQSLLISACPPPSFDIVKRMVEKRNVTIQYY
ncbi:hypothetical protein CPB84DRAFT_1846768 [Gymnopilus junonius]|uniref:Uncharacterized protein n=1 Tax=Gymnopilus junonius TaxID=109634 RepID=A0A9P5TMP7_GYMJU|nr:hypothetical protein CPB84DRAFT_1846768 [Gymnopilus junonius]